MTLSCTLSQIFNGNNGVPLKSKLGVIGNGTTRYTAYKFLLVLHTNHGLILYHFQDKARYWLKIAIFSYPTCIWRPH